MLVDHRWTKHLVRLGSVAACLCLFATATGAQTSGPNCGTFYRVQPGDTLRAITVRTYPHDRYAVVFEANRDILASPARIEVGQLLFLPCESQGPQRRSDALDQAQRQPTLQDQRGTRFAGTSAPAEEQAPAVASLQTNTLPKRPARGRSASSPELESEPTIAALAPEPPNPQTRDASRQPNPDKPILLLSASGLEPLAGDALDAGGLVGALISAALRESDVNLVAETAFVNDRKAHLDVLLPMHAFGLSYPWPAPDCAAPAGRHSRAFCENFRASAPIYQAEMRVIARSDDAAANLPDLDAMVSRIVCRPEDFPPFDLERRGIARIVLAQDLDACLEMLSDRRVDLISAPAAMLRTFSAQSPSLIELEALRAAEPVHAVFARDDVNGDLLRTALDQGLKRIQASGDWFRVVSGYLRRFNVSVAAGRG